MQAKKNATRGFYFFTITLVKQFLIKRSQQYHLSLGFYHRLPFLRRTDAIENNYFYMSLNVLKE